MDVVTRKMGLGIWLLLFITNQFLFVGRFWMVGGIENHEFVNML